MRFFATLFVLLASHFASHIAMAQNCNPSCPPVEVSANTLDGSATIPIFLIPAVKAYSPNHDNILPVDGQSVDLTNAQICKLLRDNKPSNCSTSVYPPAPGVPSSSGASWAGNGCGAGSTDPLTTYLTSLLYGKFNANYSGNLNAPIKGRPDIDFTQTCDRHDGWYTSSLTKSQADNRFAAVLTAQCGAVSDSAGQGACNTASAQYQLAVDKYGDKSYAEDQAQYQCAAWGDSMKKDGCGNN